MIQKDVKPNRANIHPKPKHVEEPKRAVTNETLRSIKEDITKKIDASKREPTNNNVTNITFEKQKAVVQIFKGDYSSPDNKLLLQIFS